LTKDQAKIRAEAINVIACNKCEMPNDIILQSEKLLFLSLRNLYYQYKQNFITKEQATREKNKLIEAYLEQQMWESIHFSDIQIHIAICKLTAPLGSKISEMTIGEAKDTLNKVIMLHDGRMSPEEII